MDIKDDVFKKVEKKTKVNKDTIISLAKKLQANNIKNESTIMEVIDSLCNITGKKISDEKKAKIVKTIVNDKVPSGVDKMF